MCYNLEILMKSENQFLLSYLCAEAIWKVICCTSHLSSILQDQWKKKKSQVVKTKWSKGKKKEENKKEEKFKNKCLWFHYTLLQQEVWHILFIWCQIHHPLKWRYRLLLASVGVGTNLQIATVRVFLALWHPISAGIKEIQHFEGIFTACIKNK